MSVAGPRQVIPGAEHVRKHLDHITQEIDHRYDHLHENAKKLGEEDYDTGDDSLVPEDCPRCQSFPISQDEIGRCTSTACHIAKPLKGKVYGYHDEDNPSKLSEDAGGHDFAVINDRYIADWWAGSYHDAPDMWDLKNPDHAKHIQKLYGNPKKWKLMYDFEKNPNKRHSWESTKAQGWYKKSETKFFEWLAKASPNVKRNRENLTPEQVFQRLSEYARRNNFAVGFKTTDAQIDGRTIFPSGNQPVSHELGHAFMTPEGQTAAEYTQRLSRDGVKAKYVKPESEDDEDMYAEEVNEARAQADHDEDVASVMEPAIARRAGVSPKHVRTNFSPNPHENPYYLSVEEGDDRDPKEIHANLQEDARYHLGQVETGQKVFDHGHAVPGTSIDAKINARAAQKPMEKVAMNPVARVRIAPPPEPVTDDMIQKPSAIGAGERDLRTGAAPAAQAAPEPFVPKNTRGMSTGGPIEYGEHVLPKQQHEAGYRMQAFEAPGKSRIVFTNGKGQHLGTAHIEHPANDPDAHVGHRFEINPKINSAHHKVIMDYLARAVRHHLYGPPALPVKKAEGRRAEWLGRPVIDAKDGDLLEMTSAIHEFQGKIPRSEAEDRAHSEYRREHHLDGAAHHLVGMKVSQAADQIDEAQKHGALYAMHMRALGHDPHAEVPGEVKSRLKPENQKLYRFRPHKADLFVLDQKDSLSKHEMRMGDILKKGDVIQFPGTTQKPSGLAAMPPHQAWDAMINGADPSELPTDHILGLLAWNDRNGEWGNLREIPHHQATIQQGLTDLARDAGLRNVTVHDLHDLAHDESFGRHVNEKAAHLHGLHKIVENTNMPSRDEILGALHHEIENSKPVSHE